MTHCVADIITGVPAGTVSRPAVKKQHKVSQITLQTTQSSQQQIDKQKPNQTIEYKQKKEEYSRSYTFLPIVVND